MTEQKAIDHLDRALAKSQFKFGQYISYGFDLWKKEAGAYIGFGIIYMIISLFASFIPIVGPLGSNLILVPCLTAGAYYFSHKTFKNKPDFANFFSGFEKIGPLIIVTLLQYLV